MRCVIALGGNALLQRGEPLDTVTQRRNAEAAAAAIAGIAQEHEVILTHGNGPQVGLLALQTASAAGEATTPLDVLGAESEGMIGYLLEQVLRNALPGRNVATLLTQVVVDPSDPAFARPTKPIGPLYDRERAAALAEAAGWTVGPDGDGYRRLVPSPEPLRIVELNAIRLLLEAGVVVVCAGGGGIPVAVDPEGTLCGVEAVIDKDLASALLAEALGADRLLLLTDVDGVQLDWGTPAARTLSRTTPAALRAYTFSAGSMAPKVEAACRFVERTGCAASIGPLGRAGAVLEGRAGTYVEPALARPLPSRAVDHDADARATGA